MRKKIAKELKSIISVDTPIGRRNYRRAKKQYSRLSEKARPLFLKNLKQFINGSN